MDTLSHPEPRRVRAVTPAVVAYAGGETGETISLGWAAPTVTPFGLSARRPPLGERFGQPRLGLLDEHVADVVAEWLQGVPAYFPVLARCGTGEHGQNSQGAALRRW